MWGLKYLFIRFSIVFDHNTSRYKILIIINGFKSKIVDGNVCILKVG